MVYRLSSITVSVAFAVSVLAQAVHEFAISAGAHSEMHPAICFDKIVWADNRDGPIRGFDIWGTSVVLPVQFPISQARGDQLRPALHLSQQGMLCVWEDNRDPWTAPDIWGVGSPWVPGERPFAQSAAPETNPRCWWPRVAWEFAWDAGETDLWCYDIEEASYELVCNAPGLQYSPDLFGYRFVWTDDRPNPLETRWDIYARDIRLPTEYQLTQSLNTEVHPRISGGWVVYEAESMLGGGRDIWARRIEPWSPAPIPVCTDLGDQRSPAIWGNLIVWEDHSPFAVTIWGYDLTSGRQFRVSEPQLEWHMDTDPDVSQNVVVFTREREGFGGDVIGALLDFCSVTGQVRLGHYVGNPQEVPVVIEFWKVGGTTPNELPVCLNPQGYYLATTLLEGKYKVSTKPRHFLRRTLPRFIAWLVPQTTVEMNFVLINGDANNDNAVNLLDLNMVLGQFGRTTPTWADLDGSGCVDIGDLNIVLMNFGLVGDQIPM